MGLYYLSTPPLPSREVLAGYAWTWHEKKRPAIDVQLMLVSRRHDGDLPFLHSPIQFLKEEDDEEKNHMLSTCHFCVPSQRRKLACYQPVFVVSHLKEENWHVVDLQLLTCCITSQRKKQLGEELRLMPHLNKENKD